MKKRHLVTTLLAASLLFVVLFYKKTLGINMLLFEAVIIPIMLFINRPIKFNLLTSSILIATLLSAIFTVIVNTSWGIFMNFLLLFCLGYVLAFQKGKSFFHVIFGTFLRCILAQFSIFSCDNQKDKTDSVTISPLKRKSNNFFIIIAIPICIFFFFFCLYFIASSFFSKSVMPFLNIIADLFSHINFSLLFFFILGLIVINPLLMRTKLLTIYKHDLSSSNDLKRIRRKVHFSFRITSLKTKNLTGIVLLCMLNVLIFYFNYLDITNIWTGFEWDGSFLKEFVHEGTWILLFTVFISAGIALYYFHNNLNFYSKNKLLKLLAVLWISQNLIMTISVAIRNLYYINYFGLAYKRIAVLFFLMLVTIGLVTVIIKVLKIRSNYFLWRINGFSLLIILTVSSLFNWDIIISKYNFSNYTRSFIEYRFMHDLSNASLPYTVKTMEQLSAINEVQEKTMPFDIYDSYFWECKKYHERIQQKKDKFLNNYRTRSILEWNLPDYSAYKKLSKSKQ